MRVLLTNDDGIQAPGLWALARAAAQLGRVTVAAPATDQSGQSAALGLRQAIRAERAGPDLPLAVDEAFVIHGSPATCVLLTTCQLSPAPFDLVLSGINHGPNVGADVWYSGTIGAARAACLLGLPAVAVSLDHNPRDAEASPRWSVAAILATALGRALLERGEPLLLSLNVPNLPFAALRGLVATTPSLSVRVAGAELLATDPASYSVGLSAHAPEQAEPGSDLWALARGQASVSLLPTLPPGGAEPDLAALCRRVARAVGLAEHAANGVAGVAPAHPSEVSR